MDPVLMFSLPSPALALRTLPLPYLVSVKGEVLQARLRHRERATCRNVACRIVWKHWVGRREEGKHTLAFGRNDQERDISQSFPPPALSAAPSSW